jgi:hypothetical protein
VAWGGVGQHRHKAEEPAAVHTGFSHHAVILEGVGADKERGTESTGRRYQGRGGDWVVKIGRVPEGQEG